MQGLVPVHGQRRARSSGHAGNCLRVPGQQQDVKSEEVSSAVLQALPHAVSHLSDTVRLASYAVFIREDSGVQRGSMSSSKVHSHKGSHMDTNLCWSSRSRAPFIPPASSKIRSQCVGLRNNRTEFCPTAAGCGARNTKALNARTLGGELGLQVLLLGSWGNRKHREVTVLNVSDALTHCASPPKRLLLQDFRKTKIHILLQRWTPACILICLSFCPSFNCIY